MFLHCDCILTVTAASASILYRPDLYWHHNCSISQFPSLDGQLPQTSELLAFCILPITPEHFLWMHFRHLVRCIGLLSTLPQTERGHLVTVTTLKLLVPVLILSCWYQLSCLFSSWSFQRLSFWIICLHCLKSAPNHVHTAMHMVIMFDIVFIFQLLIADAITAVLVEYICNCVWCI